MEGNESIKRAELFDALAHPTRIKILKLLQEKPRSFMELKKELKIESSGNLQYHLAKLEGLVKHDASGKYVLSDDAKEALRFLEFVNQMNKPSRTEVGSRKLLASLTLVILVLSAVVLFEYYQIFLNLSRSIPLYDSVDLSEGSLVLGGKKFSYMLVTTEALENSTKIVFKGVTFTYLGSAALHLPLMEVNYEDGRREVIPILPWIWKDTRGTEVSTESVLVLVDTTQGNLNQLPNYITIIKYSSLLEAKALAFQVGPKTIMLLVSTE